MPAKFISIFIRSLGFSPGALNIVKIAPTPFFKSLIVKLNIVAPRVPPKTISAAVACIIEPICPPSNTCPPRTAAIPITKPIIVVISINILYLLVFPAFNLNKICQGMNRFQIP